MSKIEVNEIDAQCGSTITVGSSGKSVAVPIPVAPVVAMVISVRAVFRHTVGDADGAAAVFKSLTVIVPVAATVPQPPLNGML